MSDHLSTEPNALVQYNIVNIVNIVNIINIINIIKCY